MCRCVSGGGVVGLIAGVEGHAVICALSAALRLTHRDAFHPLSPFCTKSREGYNMELNTCCWESKTVSAVHLDTVLPDTMTQCLHELFCLSHRISHCSCACG